MKKVISGDNINNGEVINFDLQGSYYLSHLQIINGSLYVIVMTDSYSGNANVHRIVSGSSQPEAIIPHLPFSQIVELIASKLHPYQVFFVERGGGDGPGSLRDVSYYLTESNQSGVLISTVINFAIGDYILGMTADDAL